MSFNIEDIDKINLSDVTTGEEIQPRHPGYFLQEEFINPLGLNQSSLANEIKVHPRRINEIVQGKRSITLDTALRLEAFLGMKAHMWLLLQEEYDLFNEKEKLKDVLSSIHLSPKVKALATIL